MMCRCKTSEPGIQGFSLGEWRSEVEHRNRHQRSCQGPLLGGSPHLTLTAPRGERHKVASLPKGVCVSEFK